MGKDVTPIVVTTAAATCSPVGSSSSSSSSSATTAAPGSDSGSIFDLSVAAALALGVILLLAIGLPALCCCAGLILFFKCIKGKDQQPQGQQQGATQFV